MSSVTSALEAFRLLSVDLDSVYICGTRSPWGLVGVNLIRGRQMAFLIVWQNGEGDCVYTPGVSLNAPGKRSLSIDPRNPTFQRPSTCHKGGFGGCYIVNGRTRLPTFEVDRRSLAYLV